jgi:hypothetical protein
MNEHRFAVCIRNTGYLAYLFPASMFILVPLPASIEEALTDAVETTR